MAGEDAAVREVTDLFLLHKAGGLSAAEFAAAKAAAGVAAAGGGAVAAPRAARKGSAGVLQVYLRVPGGGDLVAREIPAAASVGELRAVAAAVIGGERCRLFVGGEELCSDTASLADCGISAEAIVDVSSSTEYVFDDNVKGTAISITDDGKVARRTTGYGDGVCVFAGPLSGGSFAVRIEETTTGYSGGLGLGVGFGEGWPRQASNTSRMPPNLYPGHHFGKDGEECGSTAVLPNRGSRWTEQLKRGDKVTFTVTSDGGAELSVGRQDPSGNIDGRVLPAGTIPTGVPLYPVVDIYGTCKKVIIVTDA